jgi:hypothetical protein
MDGAPSPSLTDRLKGYLSSASYQQFSFQFGKKNRIVMAEITRANGAPNVYLSAPSGGGSFNLNDASNEETTVGVNVSLPVSEMTAAITANMNGMPGPKPVSIPFKLDATAEYDGVRYKIGPSVEIKVDARNPSIPLFDGAQTSNSKMWRIVLGGEPLDQSRAYTTFAPVDKDGKPIQYVDDKGKIVSPIKFLAENPQANSYGIPQTNLQSKYRVARISPGQGSVAGAFTLYSNIDPSQIGALQISSTRGRTVTIKGFPLDPK